MNDSWFASLYLFALMGTAIPLTSYADCQVMARNSQGLLERTQISECADLSSTQNSRIVLRGEENTLESVSSWNDDEQLRAQTIHHHLNQAYGRTLKLGANTRLMDLIGRMTHCRVRYDVTSAYNRITHFMSSKRPIGNLSLTIDAGKFQGTSWTEEIWFYRSIPTKKTAGVYSLFQALSEKNFRRAFLGQIAISRSRKWLISQHSRSLIELIGWVGLFECVLPLLTQASKAIKTESSLDSALIPEVIYHEWTHLLMSPIFGLRSSTSVNEGYANYWAAKISGMNRLLENTPREFARGRYARERSGDQRPTYRVEYDDSPAFRASGQFVFTVLMEIESVLGAELGMAVNLEALSSLNEKSDAFYALPDALLKSVHKVAPDSSTALTGVITVLRGRGLSI